MSEHFDWPKINHTDRNLAWVILNGHRGPDKIIQQDNKPYIARWHIVKTEIANVWFHIQVASDPSLRLHTHPWKNTSVYLAGIVQEVLCACAAEPNDLNTKTIRRQPGDVVHREPDWSHTLILETPYVMTLFMTGPATHKRGHWGTGYPPNRVL